MSFAMAQPMPVFDAGLENVRSVTLEGADVLRSRINGFVDKSKGYASRAGELSRKFAKAAAPVVAGAGLQFAFKSAVVGAATAAGANLYAAAALGGVSVTFVGAAQDYRNFRKTQAEKSKGFFGILKDFFSFIGVRKKEYGARLLKNTGLSALGAGVVDNFDAISSGFSKAVDFVKDRFSFPSFSLFSSVQAAGVDRVGKPLDVASIAPDDVAFESESGVVQDVPVKSGFEVALNSLNTDGWSSKALEDLKAAQAGKPWAIQNIAHYSANGFQGVPKDLDVARVFAEEGARLKSPLSVKFMADLDKISSVSNVVARVQEVVAPAPVSAQPAFVEHSSPVSAQLEPEDMVGRLEAEAQRGNKLAAQILQSMKEEAAQAAVAPLDVPVVDNAVAVSVSEVKPDVIVCNKIFNESVEHAYDCPNANRWMPPSGEVHVDDGQGVVMTYRFSGSEEYWGSNLASAYTTYHVKHIINRNGEGPILDPVAGL